MSEEEWRAVAGWEGIYEVSDHGRVRSMDRVVTQADGVKRRFRGRVRKPYLRPDGYQQVGLHRPEKGQWNGLIHRLVLEAFVGPAPEGHEACHNNGVRSDNRLENLRWGTSSANTLDMRKHGTHNQLRKTHCPRGHVLEDPNLVLSKKPKRICRACERVRLKVYRCPDLKSEFQELSDRHYAEIMASGAGSV